MSVLDYWLTCILSRVFVNLREFNIINNLLNYKFILSLFGVRLSLKAPIDYSKWIDEVEQDSFQNCEISEHKEPFLLTIILVGSPDFQIEMLQDSINSVKEQMASNWELLLVGDFESFKIPALDDHRVRVFPKISESNFFESVNTAVLNSRGELFVIIEGGDALSKYAVKLITCCAYHRLIVTDEDILDEVGRRCSPFFKPDWNPDYLSNFNYFSRAVAYDKKLFLDVGGFDASLNDPYYDLALKAVAQVKSKEIGHIDKILFHFYHQTISKVYRTQYEVPTPQPLVTVVLPIKDQVELLKTCIDGLMHKTSYKNIEVIIVDNQSVNSETLKFLERINVDSNIRILKYDKPFNYSDMNNIAVQEAKGDLLCFLNNDISMIKKDWLTEMVSQASRTEIGCVGAKLFYPDGTIQHAGVILGLKGYASHAHKGFASDDAGYGNRLIVTHNVSAVTAACMVMRKSVFEEVGGFDAENLKIAYNDVDLCLKVREAGYRNLFTPHAQLIHHESKSRGKKRNKKQQKQLKQESNFLLKKWGGVLFSDPAYNKNLSLLKEDFSLGFDRKNTHD